MIDYATAINLVNLIALWLFVFVTGGLVAVLTRRLLLYRRAERPTPLLLKRNLVFFGGLAGLILESVALRVIGGDLFTGDTLLRLLFVLHYDIIAIALFVYYLKTEISDVNDPEPDE